ncbi:unnamed protein product [Cylicostephanus goldi]|uniref:Uncharacterized protein n=1 Tax=Cylicostephanus goldi TaxID=71465 RepID=A0A3P6V0A9_CYLGO|nr:unnamed protein product [Cylicostephanus goldi]
MAKTPRPRSGVLQAVRRSLAKPGSGPETMKRLSSRIAKQMQQSCSGAVTRTSAVGKDSAMAFGNYQAASSKGFCVCKGTLFVFLPQSAKLYFQINLLSSGPADDKCQTSNAQSRFSMV